MKKIFIFLFALLPILAAAHPKVHVDRSPTLGMSYMLENKTFPGTATVLVKISGLQNAYAPQERLYLSTQSGDIYRFEVKNNMTRFLRLSPVDKSKPVACDSWFSYIYRGPVSSEVDTAFVYRMPCTTARPVKVRRRMGNGETSPGLNTRCFFRCEAGDTVYAVRRGIVTELARPRERDIDPSMLESTSERTHLTVEHPDGSLVLYRGLAEWAEPFVSEGDEVLPGQPLGLVGGLVREDDRRYYGLQTVFYRRIFKADHSEPDRFPGVTTVGFVPYFATTEGTVRMPENGECRAVMDDGLLTRELTGREIKKLKSNKK